METRVEWNAARKVNLFFENLITKMYFADIFKFMHFLLILGFY